MEDDGNAKDPKSDRSESSPTHVEWSLKINQTIVKVVFGRLLKRDEIVEVLKKKFAVLHKNITSLKPTQLMSVLAKKLVKYKYCNVKDGEIKNLRGYY